MPHLPINLNLGDDTKVDLDVKMASVEVHVFSLKKSYIQYCIRICKLLISFHMHHNVINRSIIIFNGLFSELSQDSLVEY